MPQHDTPNDQSVFQRMKCVAGSKLTSAEIYLAIMLSDGYIPRRFIAFVNCISSDTCKVLWVEI